MTYRIRETDAYSRPVGTISYCPDPEWDQRLRAAGKEGQEAAAAARAAATEAGAFRHVNPGDEVSDLPADAVPGLLKHGYIETVESGPPATATKPILKTKATGKTTAAKATKE